MARGSADRYFQAEVKDTLKLVPEGVEGQVPYKGPALGVVHRIVGGLRAAMGYTGCKTIADFHARAQFVRITNAGLSESHIHGVIVTRESPYPRGRSMARMGFRLSFCRSSRWFGPQRRRASRIILIGRAKGSSSWTCYQPIDRTPEDIQNHIAITKKAGFNLVRIGDCPWIP